MPLPDDRPSLLSLAADTERVLAETAGVDDEKDVRRRALAFRRLALIRWKLEEMDEAARLFGEAAAAYGELDSPDDLETAAAARVEQSTVLMADGRIDESLRVIEGLIEPAEGSFEFRDLTAATRSSALESWQLLLEQRNDHERLYEATGRGLALLDPSDPRTDRYALAKTLVRRAKAAEALGRGEEAVEPYKQAIALFAAEGSSAAEGHLVEAVYMQVQLLAALDLDDELAAAFDQIISSYGERKEPWAQQLVKAAHLWLEEQDEE